MDERALNYFEATVQCRTIRAAARHLYISPSSISRKLRALEQTLGTTLVDRTAYGVTPTQAGYHLLRYIRDKRHQESSLRTRLRNLNAGNRGLIRVCLGGGFVENFVSTTLAAFTTQYPAATYELTIAGGDTIVERVREGDADIGMVYRLNPDAEINIVASAPQPLNAILSLDHPLASARCVCLSELAQHPLALLPRAFHVRQLLTTMELHAGVVLRPYIECNAFDMLRNILIHCKIATILPTFCFVNAVSGGNFVTVPIASSEHVLPTAYLIRPSQRTLPTAAETLLNFISERMRTYSSEIDTCQKSVSTVNTASTKPAASSDQDML